MRTHRIITSEAPSRLERLTALRTVRYTIAIASIALPCITTLVFGDRIGKYEYIFMYFAAILATSVLGGLGPGLLATGVAIIAMHFVPVTNLKAAELRLLIIEGILVSLIGGPLRTVRLRVRDQVNARLKLEQQILEIGDDERRRIGHDLHDGLGQHLTGISLLSEAISQQLESGNKPDRATSETITELASQSVQITRDLAKSLSPVTLEQDGLIAAIEELAGTSSALFGINCRGEFEDKKLVLDRPRSLHLYRIVQEAVNNSVRHGKARNVQINLHNNEDELQIQIIDDGCGLSSKTMNNPGLGLRIMQYRARILGAALTIERATQKSGTIVTCRCPVNGNGASTM